jgi:hypothetical protein
LQRRSGKLRGGLHGVERLPSLLEERCSRSKLLRQSTWTTAVCAVALCSLGSPGRPRHSQLGSPSPPPAGPCTAHGGTGACWPQPATARRPPRPRQLARLEPPPHPGRPRQSRVRPRVARTAPQLSGDSCPPPVRARADRAQAQQATQPACWVALQHAVYLTHSALEHQVPDRRAVALQGCAIGVEQPGRVRVVLLHPEARKGLETGPPDRRARVALNIAVGWQTGTVLALSCLQEAQGGRLACPAPACRDTSTPFA